MASSVNSNAVLCVKGEIHNVLSVLRLNSRWASTERFTREVPLHAESPLARAFKGLHGHLEEVDDLANVDTVRCVFLTISCSHRLVLAEVRAIFASSSFAAPRCVCRVDFLPTHTSVAFEHRESIVFPASGYRDLSLQE